MCTPGDNKNLTENIPLKNTHKTNREHGMEHMIEQEIIALDMEALTNHIRP